MRSPVDHKQEDQDVVDRVLGGDVNAFEHLFTRYQGHVTAIVRRHVPGDRVAENVQDAFVRAFQSLAGWKAKSSFRRWLATIAVRTCYDFWRRQYRHREIPLSRLSEAHREWLENSLADRSRDDWEALGQQREAREILAWALDRLSPKDRMVLELVYLEGLAVKEAAGLLGWSAANVKVRAHRARKKINRLLLES
ncbi:MAG: RNA polymerase sigma factor [Desulfobacterales bacterium]|nr:RNA polymerase sigma factor [Desulfobacterales bacterium]